MFSFGVLLCEMCTREMPDPQRRNEQVLRVRRHSLGNLVRECLRTDPAERPDMVRIIQEIEMFKERLFKKIVVNQESVLIRGKQQVRIGLNT